MGRKARKLIHRRDLSRPVTRNMPSASPKTGMPKKPVNRTGSRHPTLTRHTDKVRRTMPRATSCRLVGIRAISLVMGFAPFGDQLRSVSANSRGRDHLPNALELIGRGHTPPCPRTTLSIQQSRQNRPASPVRSSEMLGRISISPRHHVPWKPRRCHRAEYQAWTRA